MLISTYICTPSLYNPLSNHHTDLLCRDRVCLYICHIDLQLKCQNSFTCKCSKKIPHTHTHTMLTYSTLLNLCYTHSRPPDIPLTRLKSLSTAAFDKLPLCGLNTMCIIAHDTAASYHVRWILHHVCLSHICQLTSTRHIFDEIRW